MKNQTKTLAILFAFLLLAQGTSAKECECTTQYVAAAAGGAGLLYAVPWVVGALGFGPVGVAASSFASYLMSAAATTGYGGAIIAGGQSIGAAGLGLAAKAAVTSTGAAIGYSVGGRACEC